MDSTNKNPIFSIKNFRSFGEDGADFAFAPIPVLTGCNSAGKSSMAKALMLMWGTIFNLSVEGLGRYTEQASGIFMMMVVGGGVMPLIQNAIAGAIGYMASYWLVVAMLAYILFYALVGSKPKTVK